MNRKQKQLLVAAVLVVIVSLFELFSSVEINIHDYFRREQEFPNQSISELFESIEIGEPEEIDYIRAEWEVPQRRFYSHVTKKREALRDYSLSVSSNALEYDGESVRFRDPYTHEIITDIDDIEYDHIIPISYAAMYGGNDWSKEEKNNFTYDLLNGVLTSKEENRAKGNKGPSEYIPEQGEEAYSYSWILLAEKYDLRLSEQDYEALQEVLYSTEEEEIIEQYEIWK